MFRFEGFLLGFSYGNVNPSILGNKSYWKQVWFSGNQAWFLENHSFKVFRN